MFLKLVYVKEKGRKRTNVTSQTNKRIGTSM